MKTQETFILRRLIETVVIELVSSVLIFLIVYTGIIPSTTAAYTAIYSISAVLFLLPTYIVLSAHFFALDFNIKTYLKINLPIFFIMGIINAFSLKFLDSLHYTVFFSYTKFLREVFKTLEIGRYRLYSSMAFYALFFLTIVVAMVKNLIFDKPEIDRVKKEEQEIIQELIEDQAEE
ncbi:MAG: hypothetical protein IJC89_06140 [Clostridia bacterium]|nr:hypothetical protein [Clostridia bacterium]